MSAPRRLRVVNESGAAARVSVSEAETPTPLGQIVADGETATLAAGTGRCWLTVGRHVPGAIVDITHVPARVPIDFPADRSELIVTLLPDGALRIT